MPHRSLRPAEPAAGLRPHLNPSGGPHASAEPIRQEQINTIALIWDRFHYSDITHWGRRRRGHKWTLYGMNEAIGGQDVSIGDKAVVDVPK